MTRGRPVGVTVDPRGALIVADDLSNTIRRVTTTTPVVVPADAAAPQHAAPGVDASPYAGAPSGADTAPGVVHQAEPDAASDVALTSVRPGKSVSVQVALGGHRISKHKKHKKQ